MPYSSLNDFIPVCHYGSLPLFMKMITYMMLMVFEASYIDQNFISFIYKVVGNIMAYTSSNIVCMTIFLDK